MNLARNDPMIDRIDHKLSFLLAKSFILIKCLTVIVYSLLSMMD